VVLAQSRRLIFSSKTSNIVFWMTFHPFIVLTVQQGACREKKAHHKKMMQQTNNNNNIINNTKTKQHTYFVINYSFLIVVSFTSRSNLLIAIISNYSLSTTTLAFVNRKKIKSSHFHIQ